MTRPPQAQEEERGGSSMQVPRILISPSSPDQSQHLYTNTHQGSAVESRAPNPAPPPTTTTTTTTASPRLPGSLSLSDSPSLPPRGGPPPPPPAPSPSQSFFSSLASSSTGTMISNSFSSLMLLPSKISGASVGGIKLTKISSSNGNGGGGGDKVERITRNEQGRTTTSTVTSEEPDEREEEESESESESEQSGEEFDEQSESESESRGYASNVDSGTGGGGEIGRQSMDLRLEEATTGPSAVQDTPSPVVDDSPTSSTPSGLPPALARTPSTAFRQASQEGPVHPLTLHAIRRQDSEREALRVVEELGAVFKRRDTFDHSTATRVGEPTDGYVLDRIRSESPTEMGPGQTPEPTQGGGGGGGFERGREDSQSTLKGRTTPRSVSMIGNGLPSTMNSHSTSSNVADSTTMMDRDRSVSTSTTKSKKSFFSRFKKDKSKLPASSSNMSKDASNATSTSSVLSSTSNSTGGGTGVRRSGSLMSRKGTNPAEQRPSHSSRASGLVASEPGNGGGGGESSGKPTGSKIRHPKVRTKGKSRKDFNKLFLAQELHLSSHPKTSTPAEHSDPTTTPSPYQDHHHESASIHSIPRRPSEEDHDTISSPSTETPEPPPVSSSAPGTSSSSSNSPQSRAVWAVKFSNNGKWLAVGGRDGVVRVWEVLLTKEARENQTASCSSGSGGGIMPVFKEKPIREYTGHASDVLDLNWSKNDFLLSSSMDKTVRLWHIDRDECLCSFEHLDFVTSIAFHPKDDRFFLSGSLDCKLRLWNIVEKRVQVWTELPELITAVSFTRDGQYAIAGSFIGTCMFFEVETFRFHNVFTAKSSKRKDQKGKKITSLVTFPLGAFDAEGGGSEYETDENAGSPRGRGGGMDDCDRLLVASNDSHLRLYNTKGKFVEAKYSGHENTSSQIRASFSDDGKFVICGSEDRHVYIWDSGIVRNAYGDFDVTKKRSEGSGFESFSMSAHIVTSAIFAPTTTRSHLAKSGDPIFSNADTYPQLDPLPYSATRSSLGATSEKSESKKGSSTSSTAAEDMIIVVADAETGVISIFRNSRIPPSVLSPASASAPPSASGSIFRHHHHHHSHASSASLSREQKEKRWSRASATSH